MGVSLPVPSVDAVDIGRSFLFRGMCKRPFERKFDDNRPSLILPCGKCLACRIRRRSVWTIRLLHENAVHDHSRFITLTYRDEALPRRGGDPRGILVKSDLQNFFKRFRKVKHGKKIKFYACGEYGELGRPHYHAILFGDAPTEVELRESWGMGHAQSDMVSGKSIAYVAGYVSKKLGLRDYDTADSRPAPFQLSSQGLGLKWAQENVYEILMDAAIIRGATKLPIPRSYLLAYDEAFPDESEGFRSRQIFESDLVLTDRILEVLPEGGGRSWSQLDQDEKDFVLSRLQDLGHTYDQHLRIKQSLYKEGKL